MTPIASLVPDVVLLLEEINASTGAWFSATDLSNGFLYTLVHIIYQKQFASNWQEQSYNFTSYLKEYSNSLASCYNLVHRDLDHLLLQQDVTLTHYIDDILVIGHTYKELASILYLMVRHLHAREWKINLTRLRHSTSVNIYGGGVWGMLRYSF